MWAWLLGLGGMLHAGAPATPKQALAPLEGVANIAGACAPLGTMLPMFQGLRFPLDSTSPGRLGWELLQDTAATWAAGVDLDGALLLWSQGGQEVISLPFTGSAALQRSFLERLFPGQAISAAAVQTLTLPSGLPVQVTTTATAIQLASGGDEITGIPAPALLANLPDAPGCLLYAAIPGDAALPAPASRLAAASAAAGPLPAPEGLAIWLPAGAGPAELRLQTAAPLLPGLGAPHVAPIGGSSAQPPVALITLGVEILPLLLREDAPWSGRFPADMERLDLETLRRRFWIPGGITVAVLNLNKSAPRMAVVIPVTARERPIKVRALRRALRRSALRDNPSFSWTSRTTFQFQTPQQSLYGVLDTGRLLMGTDLSLLYEIQEGRGQPWLDAAAMERAATWPLYAEVAIPLRADLRVSMGLRAQDAVLQLALDTPGVPLGQTTTDLLARVSPLLSQQNAEAIYRIRRAEAPQTLTALCAAQEAHRSRAGAYLSLPPAPRRTEDLDSAYVVWPTAPPEGWDRLGWTPPGNLRGTYWATASGTGADARVSLYGAIDADGDGTPAEHVLHCPAGPEPILLSAPDTY